MTEQIARLRNAGYGVFLIGHVKVKDKIDPVTGDVYEQYTNNLSNKYFGAVADTAQMVVNIVNQLNIVGGTEDKAGRVSGSDRIMYFRDTGLIDAKSRFVGVPDSLPLSAKNFLEAFKMGVRGSQTQPIEEKEIKKQAKKEQKESEIQYNNLVKSEQNGNTKRKEDLSADIQKAMKDILSKKNATATASLQAALKKYNISNIEMINSLELTDLISLLSEIEKIN